MNYIHSKDIAHRDIKLDNILVVEGGLPKLIDFGFSQRTKNVKLKDFCGTPAYIGPEVLKRKSYLAKPCDVWAFGIMAFKLVAGYFPFSGKDFGSDFFLAESENELYSKILFKEVQFPMYFSQDYKDFLLKMFVKDPKKRITFS